MSYKTAQIKGEDFGLLSPKLREEINNIKNYTEGYNMEYFDIFENNDQRLFALAEAELERAKAKKSEEKPKVEKKAESPKPKATEKPTEKPKAKETKKEEKKPAVKAVEKEEKVEKTKSENPDYVHSWKRKISDASFNAAAKVELTCDFRVLTAEKSGKVEIKSTFNKGDKLLVHEDGYPFAVMTEAAYEKRCKVLKKSSTPRSKKEPAAKQPKKAEVIQTFLNNPSVPLLTWLDGQIELWKNRQSNQKITKIMVILKTGEIVIEYTHYDKLLRVADLRYSYHKICPETAKLTKMLPPKRGTYRMLVTKQALKEQYATNRNWEECQLWIREAYQCSRDGDCSREQKELFSLYYKQCGDQRVKEENIAYLRWLHKQAGEQWKRGEESYLGAFSRVKRELSDKK
jgi:hypothetical protein